MRDRLATERRNNGLTQAEAAEKLGVVPETVANWESGRAEPSVATLRKLADLYGVPLAELVG